MMPSSPLSDVRLLSIFSAAPDSISRTIKIKNGGLLYVAPEGTSFVERRLRPLKTGTARIALRAEASADFQLELKIYPVGLTYEQPTQCGSRVYLEAVEPLHVAEWKTAYEEDPRAAAYALTDALAERMQSALLHPDDAAQDELLYRLETIQKNDAPLPIDQHYDRTKALLKKLQALRQSDHDAYEKLRTAAQTYRESLRQHGITDRGITKEKCGLFTIISLLGWPIWLYGRLNNVFPYDIPRRMERKMDLYIGYRSTVKILAGLVLFPLFYILQFQLAKWLLPISWAWAYLLSLPVSGALAWCYARHVKPRWEARTWRKFKQKQPTEAQALQTQRAHLQAFTQ